MKRRSLLRTLVAAPAAAVLPASGAGQQNTSAARDKGLPAGPALVPPGINETPNTPVIPADEAADNVVRTFDAEQMAALKRLGEITVPPYDGNPGAGEAGAAEFLDFLIGCSPRAQVELYKNGLDTLNRRAKERFGKAFAQVSSAEADQLLAPLREPWTYPKAGGDGLAAFLIAAKADFLRATVNSRPYIDAISQRRRPRNASNFYWYPIS